MSKIGTVMPTTVESAFEAYKQFVVKGERSWLSQHVLATAESTAACWGSGQILTQDERLAALRATLEWAVERLKPSGSPDWHDPRWRHYLSIHYSFIEPWSVARLMKKLDVVRGTVYSSRKRAFSELAYILEHEHMSLADLENRRAFLLSILLKECTHEETVLLRSISIYRHNIPLSHIKALTSASREVLHETLRSLLKKRLLYQFSGELYALNPIFQPHLSILTKDRVDFLAHKRASQWYRDNEQHPFEVVYHSFMAQLYLSSAEYLLKEQTRIRADTSHVDIVSQLRQFQYAPLDREVRLNLRLLHGELLSISKQQRDAVDAFQEALASKQAHTQAKAHLRLGQHYRQQNLDTALEHFAAGIDLLTVVQHSAEAETLMELYLKRAFPLARERWQPEQVQHDLYQVAQLLETYPNQHLLQESQYHNVWARYYRNIENPEQEHHHLWKAWRAAAKTGDKTQRMKMSHNLAMLQIQRNEYELAFDRFQESQRLALILNDQRMLLTCYLSLGACKYEFGEYKAAIALYKRGKQLSIELNLSERLGYACFNLAEVLAKIGRSNTAKEEFDESHRLATELDISYLHRMCAVLTQQYPELSDAVTDRQRTIIGYVRQNGSISRKVCCELVGLSPRQAARELNGMLTIELGILMINGSGRSTIYVIRVDQT